MELEKPRDQHLSDGDLFVLAMPPVGEPEALPRHLSECVSCSRAFSEWKVAVRDLVERDTDALSRRTSREWETLEDRTLEAIRATRLERRRRLGRWAVAAVAASLLLFALLVPLARSARRPAAVQAVAAQLSTQDREDDLLLRDVARLSRGDDGTGGSWNSLAPEPEKAGGDEDKL
jgi:hypothetical protein